MTATYVYTIAGSDSAVAGDSGDGVEPDRVVRDLHARDPDRSAGEHRDALSVVGIQAILEVQLNGHGRHAAFGVEASRRITGGHRIPDADDRARAGEQAGIAVAFKPAPLERRLDRG